MSEENIEIIENKNKIIRNRSYRWLLISFILTTAPISFTILIASFANYINPLDVLLSGFLDGTILIIAVSLAGSQYLSLTYSKRYNKIDSKTNGFIITGFLGICLFCSMAFTIIKIQEASKNPEVSDYYSNVFVDLIDPMALVVYTVIVLSFSIFYTIKSHKIKTKYDLYFFSENEENKAKMFDEL